LICKDTMNRTIISLIVFSLILSLNSSANYFQSDNLTQEVSQAVRTGNSRELANFFSQNIDLTLPDSEGTFSKAQAEVIIRNFFSRNTPTSFLVSHQGTSRDGSSYAIGIMQTRQGQAYRVYFLLKKVSENTQLHQLQFEPN